MITYLILYPIGYLITKFIGLFPDSSGFSSAYHSAFSYIGNYIYGVSVLFPLSDIKNCLITLIAAEILIWQWENIKWIISHVPFIGGRG